MNTYPDRDCAHLRGDYKPIVIDERIVGSRLANWCCDLNGCQSCGTVECPTDRGGGVLQTEHWWQRGQYA